jgi:hypothetical protein
VKPGEGFAHGVVAVDAAMKEGAYATERTGSAEGIEHPVAEGAPELP